MLNCQSLWQTCHIGTIAAVCMRVQMTDTGADTSLNGVFLKQQLLPSVFFCLIGLDFHSSLQAGALFPNLSPLHSHQVRCDSKTLLSAFVFWIMESLIYLIWPSQIKKKGKDACVLEMEATCKSNFFGGRGEERKTHGGETRSKDCWKPFNYY